jgi:uncharacterized protein YuzE
MKLSDLLPEFAAELEACLERAERKDIASQICEVEFERYTYDTPCNAAYVYVRSPRALNAVEQNIIGIHHGETIEVEHPYWVNVDTDNFGRLRGIELLSGGEVAAKLSSVLPS